MSFPEIICEELDIKQEPEDFLEIETKEQIEDETALPKKIKLDPSTQPPKKTSFKNNKSRNREEEFHIFSKYITTQLKQLPLDVSLVCRNEIQALITKARLSVSNIEKKETECKTSVVLTNKMGVYGSLGSYVSKKLRNMESKQQTLAEDLILTVISQGSTNKLTEKTVICNRCTDTIENRLSKDIDNINSNLNKETEKIGLNVLKTKDSSMNSNISKEEESFNSKKRKKRRSSSPESIDSDQQSILTDAEDNMDQDQVLIKPVDPKTLPRVFVLVERLEDQIAKQIESMNSLETTQENIKNQNVESQIEKDPIVPNNQADNM